MFAGIVEECMQVVSAYYREESVLQIRIERPLGYNDLHLGDSILVNGVCLTLESITAAYLQFALGPETLRVTTWTADYLVGQWVNLERSLRLQDRIHGHLVTGHVDGVGNVITVGDSDRVETRRIRIGFLANFSGWVWSKGSICVQGVSLTINDVGPNWFEVGLIPETLRRTNLGRLMPGDRVNLEADAMAKAVVHAVEQIVSTKNQGYQPDVGLAGERGQ